MYRRLIVIKDKKQRQSFWESLFDVSFNKHECIFVNNKFNCHPSFHKEFTSKEFSFYCNGYYFSRIKKINFSDNRKLNERLKNIEMDKIPLEFDNGAYSMLVIKKNSAIIFNDFLGLQTLYEYKYDGAVIFSTSLRSLAKAFNLDKDIEAIQEYLVTGTLLSGRSGLKDVRLLSPASIVEISVDNIEIRNYSHFSDKLEMKKKFMDYVDSTDELLLKATEKLYNKDIKYTLSLSGGMDSRLIYMNWPDRLNLLTETAGEGTSDYIKAKKLVKEYGNVDNHKLEMLTPGDIDGLDQYYNRCDNPLLAKSHHNMKHVEWKKNRGSLFHLSGVGGELIGGENLYFSRNPLSVIKEAFFPYSYTKLTSNNKNNAFKALLKYDKKMLKYLDANSQSGIIEKLINETLNNIDIFFGKTKYLESYLERIRTLYLAQAGYYLLGSLQFHDYLPISPYNDRELIQNTCIYEPKLREMRKGTIKILKKTKFANDIPIDTTHLKINKPYFMHKVMRVIRMVVNIGYKKKIPLLQKGNSPKQRYDPYFNPNFQDYRDFINKKILSCEIFNKSEVNSLINDLQEVYGADFYTRHGVEQEIRRLLRVSYFCEI